MAREIMRQFGRFVNLALTTSSSTTPEIRFDGYAAGLIFIPSGSSITTLTFWVASRNDTLGMEKAAKSALDAADAVTYVQLLDDTGTAITRTVAASRACRIPLEAFAAGGIKITVDVAGSVDLALKS